MSCTWIAPEPEKESPPRPSNVTEMDVPESAVDPPESETKLHGADGRLCATRDAQLSRTAEAKLRINAEIDVRRIIG
jgi:hypothetical protein